MTQFGQPTPIVSSVRRAMSGIPRQRTGSVETSTRIPLIRQGGGRSQSSLVAILESVGAISRVTSQFVDEERRRGERVESQAAQLEAGRASLDARSDLPDYLSQIAQDETLPDTDDLREFAERWVTDRVSDQPESYQQAYRNLAQPAIIKALVDQEDRHVEQGRARAMTLTAEGLVSATSLEQAQSQLSAATELHGLNDYQRVALVAPMLRSAAEQGDAERLRIAQQLLGDRLPIEQQRAQAIFESRVASNVAEQRSQRRGQVLSMINNPDAPTDLIEATISQAAPSLGPDATADLQSRLRTRQGAESRDFVNGLSNNIHQAIAEDQPFDTVVSRIESARPFIGEEKAEGLRQAAIDTSQSRLAAELESDILLSRITPDRLREVVAEAVARDPDSPQHITARKADSIMSFAREERSVGDSRQRVELVLNGEPGVLYGAGDANSLLEAIRDRGGIDGAGRIVNPAGFTLAVNRGGVMAGGLRDIIIGHLESDDMGALTAGVQVVGMMATGDRSERMFGALSENASDGMRRMIHEIEKMAERGDLTPEAIEANADRLAKLRAEPATTKPSEGIRQQMQDQGIDMPSEIRNVIESVRDQVGGDVWWWNDPETESRDGRVNDRIAAWYTSEWEALAGLPSKERKATARKSAARQVRQNVDLVRFNGDLWPVEIDNGSQRLPQQLRWTPGFEPEIDAMLEAHKRSADEVGVVEPYLNPILSPRGDGDAMATDQERLESSMGWIFRDRDFQPITDRQGNILIYHPSETTKHKAAEYQDSLDRKSSDMAVRLRARSFPAKNYGQTEQWSAGPQVRAKATPPAMLNITPR